MRIALLGYGKMNRLIEQLAREANQQVAFIARSNQNQASLLEGLKNCDVAIDFSVASAVLENVEACAKARVPLVIGTTGWRESLANVSEIVAANNALVLYGANFSIGVNLFYKIAARAAELFASLESYEAFIEEAHHKQKRDAPSGTALNLQQILSEKLKHSAISVSSTRAGFFPGTHTVGFDSVADTVTLTHAARSREGFARGALQASVWLAKNRERRGLLEFSETLDEILQT